MASLKGCCAGAARVMYPCAPRSSSERVAPSESHRQPKLPAAAAATPEPPGLLRWREKEQSDSVATWLWYISKTYRSQVARSAPFDSRGKTRNIPCPFLFDCSASRRPRYRYCYAPLLSPVPSTSARPIHARASTARRTTERRQTTLSTITTPPKATPTRTPEELATGRPRDDSQSFGIAIRKRRISVGYREKNPQFYLSSTFDLLCSETLESG